MLTNVVRIVGFGILFITYCILAQNKKLVENRDENGQILERYYVINDTLIDGEYLLWSDSGHKFVSGYYKKGIADGKWIQYYSTGAKRVEGSFKNGIPDGTWFTYSPNGAKHSKTGVKDGLLHGEWAIWYTALSEYHIIFNCGDPYEGTGHGEEWFLKEPINKKISLLKANGFFNNGIPSGTWTIYEHRLKDEEIIFKRSKDENYYSLKINWEPYHIKESKWFFDLGLQSFICDRLPDFPSYILIYYTNGKMTYKAEFKENVKIFEKKY